MTQGPLKLLSGGLQIGSSAKPSGTRSWYTPVSMEGRDSSHNHQGRGRINSMLSQCDGKSCDYVYYTCSTFRKDCPAEIRLRSSMDGQLLVITKVNEEHNHELNKVGVYSFLCKKGCVTTTCGPSKSFSFQFLNVWVSDCNM